MGSFKGRTAKSAGGAGNALAALTLVFSLVLGLTASPASLFRSAAAAPTLVSAENTVRTWEATSSTGALVTLDGSASSADAVLFAWWKDCAALPCPGGVQLAGDSADVKVTSVQLPIGAHEITFWAADDENSFAASSPITVTVVATAPVAEAGTNQSLPATSPTGAAVTLNGSGSTAATGATYSWSTVAGGVIATGATPAAVSFPIGTTVVTLTVTSIAGAATTDTVSITVTPVTPVAEAGPAQTVASDDLVDAAVTLNGGGSTNASTYAWDLPGTLPDAVGVSPVVTLPVGVTTITLTVTSVSGATATDTVAITVTADGPEADAGTDQNVDSPGGSTAVVTLDGSDSENVLSFSWDLPGDLANATGEAPEVTLPAGANTITLTATGAAGATDTDSVVINVVNANAGPDQSVFTAPAATTASVTLNGAGSSLANSFSWDLPGTLPNASGASPVVTLPIGANTITLTVTGPGGVTDTDTVVITVAAPPAINANAGPDQTVVAANGTTAQVTLNGAASTGAVSYSWDLPGDLPTATGVSPVVTLPLGVNVITLTVTGAGGPTDTDTDTVQITVTKPTADATVTPVRGIVGSSFDFTIIGFPSSTVTSVFLVGPNGLLVNLGPVTTNASGVATGTRVVPTVPGGVKEIRFAGGGEVESAEFEVAPRIRVTPASVQRGQTVAVALTGFGRNEVVRIRWNVGGTYVQVGQVTTGTNGSLSTSVVVPANAAAGANMVRGDGTVFAAQTNAVTVVVPQPPSATLDPVRGTVNQSVAYSLANFPANTTVTITYRRTTGGLVGLGAVQTNGSGAATGSFVVPATPGGPNQQVTFAAGSATATAVFEVAPRIKVAPGAVGDRVDVSLRGFGRGETVRIRWLVDGTYVQVGVATTSNTGSANVPVTVPAGAAPGNNSVRGDGTSFRAQTNVALVTD